MWRKNVTVSNWILNKSDSCCAMVFQHIWGAFKPGIYYSECRKEQIYMRAILCENIGILILIKGFPGRLNGFMSCQSVKETNAVLTLINRCQCCLWVLKTVHTDLWVSERCRSRETFRTYTVSLIQLLFCTSQKRKNGLKTGVQEERAFLATLNLPCVNTFSLNPGSL